MKISTLLSHSSLLGVTRGDGDDIGSFTHQQTSRVNWGSLQESTYSPLPSAHFLGVIFNSGLLLFTK